MGEIVKRIQQKIRLIDFFLLFFLLGFMVDKVVLKPVFIVMGLLWMGSFIKWKDWLRSPVFYLAIAAMEVVRFLLFNSDFSAGHLVSFAVGESYWIMAFLAFMMMKTIIRANGLEVINTTLTIYFLINAAVSLGQLALVMYHSGSLNPYELRNTDYGNSTGDYIRGIVLAPCHINMLINCLFSVYFLYRKQFGLYFVGVVVAILTTTNFGNIIFAMVIIGMLFFVKGTSRKIVLGVPLILYGLFYVFVSRNNFVYMLQSLKDQRQSIQKTDDRKKKARSGLALNGNTSIEKKAGKLMSFEQTYKYSTASAGHFIFGAGIGNFSSLLALRTSGIRGKEHSRFFEMMPEYIAPEFHENHYKIFRDVYDLPEAYHSAKNFPHSFINQLVGEYGFLGVLLFIFFYALFFLKRWRQLSFTVPMIFLIAGFLCFDYLFEYLSVILLFEIFFLTDCKRYEQANE